MKFEDLQAEAWNVYCDFHHHQSSPAAIRDAAKDVAEATSEEEYWEARTLMRAAQVQAGPAWTCDNAWPYRVPDTQAYRG